MVLSMKPNKCRANYGRSNVLIKVLIMNIEHYEEYKIVALSTGLLTDDDMQSIRNHILQAHDTDNNSMMFERNTGFFLKLYDEKHSYDDELINQNLKNIIFWAIDNKYRMIEFDRDVM